MPIPVTPGVYAPILTFFKAGSEDLDLDTFRTHVLYLARSGVAPVVCGTMGEAPMLSVDERVKLVEVARKTLDEDGRRLPLIVGTGLPSTRETLALTEKVAAAGADAVLVIPAGYYAPLMTPAALKSFYSAVAEKSPVPVMLYNFPGAAGGVDMDSDLLEEIARAPNVCGAKLTCSAIGKFTRLAGATSAPAWVEQYPRSFKTDGPPFVLLTGFSDFIVAALAAQAHGAITGFGNLAPRVLGRLYALAKRAAESGSKEDKEAATTLQTLVAEADYQTSALHIPGAKQILQQRKGYGGLARAPLQPADKALYDKVMKHPAVVRVFALETELERDGQMPTM